MSRRPQYDLFLKLDDDLEIRWINLNSYRLFLVFSFIFTQAMSWFSLLCVLKYFLWFSPWPYMFDFSRSGDKLSRALLGEQPWAPSTLYCFPLTRVPPYRFIFNTTGKYNYKLHIYLWQIPIIRKSSSSRQSTGRNAKMFVAPSIFSPSIYPGSFP